jgi:HEAT repeat protein
LGYATPSDPLLRFALLSGLLVFALTLALLVAIVVLRYVKDRRDGLEKDLAERWHPVFFHAVEGLPFQAPRILGRDREVIMLVWIHFSESISGEARRRLRHLARELKFEDTALRLLRERDFRSRLLAVVVLGRMKSVKAWDSLAGLVADRNPTFSLLVARSLLQIDAARALRPVMQQIVQRDDWPSVKLASMLSAVAPGRLTPALLEALATAEPSRAPRLLGLLDAANTAGAWPVLAPLLRADQPLETLVAALKACNDPRGIEAIRLLIGHEAWMVRAQAATALGRLGFSEDALRLQALLGDAEWWVRYRAGLALVRMPFVPRQALIDLCPQLEDRFAADMLRQVLAETAPGAPA